MNGLLWQVANQQAIDLLGFIPSMLDLNDERPAAEQFDERYAHGGGWKPYKGFTMDTKTGVLKHPGDPDLKPIAGTTLRDEAILVYECAWVAIYNKANKTYEVARMD